jgi:hypothetical protein
MSLVDPRRMSIDALISFGRDENPNAATKSVPLDAGDIILEIAQDDNGNPVLRTAYTSDLGIVDKGLGVFGASRFNLRNIVDFIVREKLLDGVRESQKEQVNTAIDSLNGKIDDYNSVLLRPWCSCVQLPKLNTLALDPTASRRPIVVAERVVTATVAVTVPGAGNTQAQLVSSSAAAVSLQGSGSASQSAPSVSVQVAIAPAIVDGSRRRLHEITREVASRHAREAHRHELDEMEVLSAKIGKGAGAGEFNTVLSFAKDLYEAANMSRQVADFARHIIFDPKQHKICSKGDGNLVFAAFAQTISELGGSKSYAEKLGIIAPAADLYTATELRALTIEHFHAHYKTDPRLRRLLLSSAYEYNASLELALAGYTRGGLLNIDQAFATFDSYIPLQATADVYVTARQKQKEFRALVAAFETKSEAELIQQLTLIKNGVLPVLEMQLAVVLAKKLDHKDKAVKAEFKKLPELLKKLQADSDMSVDERLAQFLAMFKTIKEGIKKPFAQITDKAKVEQARAGKFCEAASNLINLISQMQTERQGVLDMTLGQRIEISATNPDKVFADYFKLVEKDGFWAALPEIYSLCRILKINAIITTKQGGLRSDAPALMEYLPIVDGAETFLHLDFEDKSKFTLYKEPVAVEGLEVKAKA